MRDPAFAPALGGAAERRFLTFRVDERLYAVPAEEVAEVIRVPAAARVPQAPPALVGLANIRGSVLPLASLRSLLGRGESGVQPSSRAIVLEGASPVALLVDAVQALVSVDPERVEMRQAELAAEPGESLAGVFDAPGQDTARILDARALLSAAFAMQKEQRQGPRRRNPGLSPGAEQDGEAQADRRRLLTFVVAGQGYALRLEVVQEIVPAPESLAVIPRAETLVLGVTPYRQTLLPLLSLRGLLGLPAASDPQALGKVVVVSVAGVLVGLVVDATRAIVSADPKLVDPFPPVLSARAGGESRIEAMYRDEAGGALISILSPEQLFREDVMQRLRARHDAAASDGAGPQAEAGEERAILVFRLGDSEFGLPIEAVDEVAPVPDRVARLPRAPKFLEGVVNLRGEVLPVVDQRRRFDMPPLADAAERRRLVVVQAEGSRAGLIVDSVSGVLRTPADAIEPTPALTEDMSRLVRGVLNLDDAARMVLVLDPSELLTRAERELLDAFTAKARQAPP